MIELDGNYLEGGGSIVRVALALSTFTQRPFHVYDIRKGRDKPGLKAQHLTAIKALKEMSGAKTGPIALGDRKLEFYPGKVKGGTYVIDIGTAGSISLLLQALILPCLFAPQKITLKVSGGTCGKGQASVDYLQSVFLPLIQPFAEKIELKILKRGYYPKGGGLIVLEINQKKNINLQEMPKINLEERGELDIIKGTINCSRNLEKSKVGERIKESAERALRKLNCPVDILIDYAETSSPGGEIVLWAKFSKPGKENNPLILGADSLVEKEKKAEEVGREAAEKLIALINQKSGADPYLADQLLMFMALLSGSKIKAAEITNHSLTNIYVIERFLNVKFLVKDKEIQVLENYLNKN